MAENTVNALDDVARRLITDLPFFAEKLLKIQPKSGGQPVAFSINRAQQYVHQRLEEQRARTGKVRAYILKGRQQGMSTYVGARFYHRTTTRFGLTTFIFAHESTASAALYSMVQRFYDCTPDALRPKLGARNYNELTFSALQSGYKVGTAGSGGLGRGKTVQLLHWSEVAYSPNCNEHAAGILQAVPDLPDTEIILESTANGEGDFFHAGCMKAMSGEGDYQLIFVPWYWQHEYTRAAGGFEPDDIERDYLAFFGRDGLTVEHLSWRRAKIAEFGGDLTRFKHEYPFTVEEAFETSDADALIKATAVRAARDTPAVNTNAPLVFGVDPAALGGDKFRVTMRKGRNLTKIVTIKAGEPNETSRELALLIGQYKPARVFIDVTGMGISVWSHLKDMGYGQICSKVIFTQKRIGEMYRSAFDWFNDPPVSISCAVEDAAVLQAELSGRRHKWGFNGDLVMESKAEIKKRLGYSPDTADSFILTFAEPVAEVGENQARRMQSVTVAPNWNPL